MVICCRPSDSDIGGGSIMEHHTIEFLDSPMRNRQSSILKHFSDTSHEVNLFLRKDCSEIDEDHILHHSCKY